MPTEPNLFRRRSPFKDNRPFKRVEGEGPVPAEIMLIGERPGENEARAGRPFIGAAGRILDTMLGQAGIDRQGIYVTNLVKDFQNYDKPTEVDITNDRAELDLELSVVSPRVCGLLGTFATEAVLGWGRAQLERTHGVPVPDPNGGSTIYVPCFHPAAGIYNQEHLSYFGADCVALAMVRDGELLVNPDKWKGRERYSVWDQIGGAIRLDCAIDTEGSKRKPWCMTWSTGYGMSWLTYPGQKVKVDSEVVYVHNSLHDLPVLRQLGIPLRDGQFRDTMVWAYLLCLEPQGLKDLAYRHAGMEMDSYQEIIAEADQRLALDYLRLVENYEWQAAEEYVKEVGGIPKITRPQSINRRVRNILRDVDNGKVKKSGDPVDPRARWDDIDPIVKQEVVETIGEMPEATLDDVDRGRAEHYACRDSDATLRIAPILKAKISEMGLDRVSEIDHAIIPMIDRMGDRGIGVAGAEFWDGLEEKCDGIMGKARKRIYDLTKWQINPNSPDQVRELLFEYLKLPIVKWTGGGKNGKDGAEASTQDKALEAIHSLHPVVDCVLEYREASKVKSSFCRPLRERAGADRRIHCNLRITRVSSGRLAATGPNLLAIPVRSSLGREIRDGFVTDDGRIFADYDLDQVEMRWMADESRDEALVRLFVEGTRDVHTSTAAGMFSVPYSGVAVEQRYAAKRVGFGVITGITEHGLVDQMSLARAKRPDGEDWTLDDCALMIKEYFNIYPGVERFMVEAGDEVERDGVVRDRWGRIRYLPGAWSPIPAVKAEARRQASSHKIQAGAQGFMKQGMAKVWEWIKEVAYPLSWEERWPVDPLLQIHDSLLMEIDDDECLKEMVAEEVVGRLTKTVKSRTGLPFKAKGGFGRTWAGVKG